jgi:cyclophilin family peptidyl-prolyl cis-trans isomerase
MPKTANKRAEARRVARIQRAHQAAPERPVTRRVPKARRRARRGGLIGAVRSYPWASTFFAVLVVGLAVLFMRGQQLGPFAVSKPAQAVCNLKTHTCNKAPLMTINPNKTYIATIKTARGDIVIQLDAKHAPLATNNFVFLADQHFYDGLDFWRVEKVGQPSPLNGQPSNLDLIQGGASQPNGKGNVGYSFKDDPITGTYTAGTVAMANAGPNTNGSQFFICTGDDTVLPKNYDIFGTVTSGLDVAKAIQPGDKILSVTITVK